MALSESASALKVALLTAGRDRPYAFGMASALMAKGLSLDIIGGDDLDCPQWHETARVRFLNFRGDLSEQASLPRKVMRILEYYARLLSYALTSQADIFHILWNNKFEVFDRVPLMLYYRLLGKKTVLTVHNVNMRERDDNDSWFNRLTLRIQYGLADHLFVHTKKMKQELADAYGVPEKKITVIPFGINNAVPITDLTRDMAREKLGLQETDRVILFFGNIAPYKGLELLVDAFHQVLARDGRARLFVAGRVKDCEEYWESIKKMVEHDVAAGRVFLKVEYIKDAEVEVYFKAADLLVLPYRHVYQSGVLFLGYSFGLPTIATDVGALRQEIVGGETGFVCQPEDPAGLAKTIEKYFFSDLYRDLKNRRAKIQNYARETYSWEVVSETTRNIYQRLLGV